MVGNCLIVGLASLCIAACAGPGLQVPVQAQGVEKVTTTDVLKTCAVIQDQDMAEIRGCYDSFYTFGLDFIGTIDFSDLARSMKTIEGKVSAYATAVNADKLTTNANFNNGQVGAQAGAQASGGLSFEAGNSQVAFHSSIGNSPLGTGVIQLVQVMGNNNLVIANTNVTLNIKNFQPINTKFTGLTGLNFLGRQ